jgi:hypothetical protein
MTLRILLAVVTIVAVSGAWAETTGEMFSNCRPIADATIKSDGIIYKPTLATQTCWGAFSVIAEVVLWVDEEEKRVLHTCSPAEARRSQLIAIFVEYAKNSPREWHEDFFLGWTRSLKQAYPCT